MTVRILQGDCRDVLKTLPAESVHCIVTSPPYFGLRDYGVDGQMGLEPSPEAFIAGMVEVFRECRRVLRDDGTLWLNIGDSYCSGGGKDRLPTTLPGPRVPSGWTNRASPNRSRDPGGLIKPKDLMGIPWMLAFALRADGWYLRQDIIWHKPNPMPESVRDRCTKAHEYLFLLSKGPQYHFDASAITEASAWDPAKSKMPDGWDTGPGGHGSFHRDGREAGKRYSFAREAKAGTGEHGQKAQHRPDREDVAYVGKRNKRSVWTIPTAPFKEAHFATFPPALVEPCILAGCPEGGTVLDPFGGAGTTGLVADRLHRDAILIELNPDYAAIARKRICGDSPLFSNDVVAA